MTKATPPAAGLGPLRRSIREVGLGLIALGVVVLLFVAYQLFGTSIAANRHQASLARAFRAAVAAAPPTTAPAPGSDPAVVVAPSTPAATGGVVAHLVIPKINVDRYVVDGTTESDLSEGPGHYAGTPYPGEVGDVAIAGHRTTYGAPFYRLGSLGVGDHVYLTDTAGHTFDYVVDQPSLVVSPNDVSVIGPTPDATLTLTTCNPPLSATSRLIVKAKLVGTAARTAAPAVSIPASGGAVEAPVPVVAVRANLTGGSSSAWPPTIGFGALAVLAWIAVRLAVAKLRRGARLGGAAVGLALCGVALWFAFAGVIRLLPQSI